MFIKLTKNYIVYLKFDNFAINTDNQNTQRECSQYKVAIKYL